MTTALTRRRLLHLIGATAGSAALYQAAQGLGVISDAKAEQRPDIAPLGKNRRKVLILGAGISGLTAAYELNRKGYECLVLDASFRAGGRNLTLRHGSLVDEIGNPQICRFDKNPDLFMNAGPARLPGHMTVIMDYCRELGVELAPFVNTNYDAWIQDDAAFGGRRIRYRDYVTDARGFIAEIAAKSISGVSLESPVTSEDAEKVLAMLRAFGDLDSANRYKGSTRAGLKSTNYAYPPELKKPHTLSELLMTKLWHIVLTFGQGEDQTNMMMEPVGGMDKVVDGFMRRIGHLVHTHCRVEAITARDDGVEVIYQGPSGRRKVKGDFCLNCIPLQLMAGIPNNFSPEYNAVFTAIPRGKLMKIGFQMRERFWEKEMIYGGITWTKQDITQLWYPCHGINSQKGVVIGAYVFGGPASERFERMMPAERLEVAIRQGEKVHPGYRGYVETGNSVVWHRMNNLLGCASEWTPELRKQYFARIQAPFGRHYMMGDQVSYHPGWQQGAMCSALYAIKDIDARVRAELSTKGAAV